jgi:hypothetical protein
MKSTSQERAGFGIRQGRLFVKFILWHLEELNSEFGQSKYVYQGVGANYGKTLQMMSSLSRRPADCQYMHYTLHGNPRALATSYE